jgi:tetratricopeptide (TPR) repeat protein
VLLLWAGVAAAEDAATADELLDLSVQRLDTHDWEGARILVDQALGRPGADVDRATYVQGLSWELQGDASQAIALYDVGLEQWPTSPLNRHRRFRRAEALGTLGEPLEALRWLRSLDRADLDAQDRRKLTLVRGVLLLDAGKERKGLKHLEEGLQGPADQLTFYQAKARAALAELLATESQGLHLDARERRVQKRLVEHARLLGSIEKQVTAIAELDEPEWVLEGLLHLGAAYERLGDHLSTHRRPRRLTPDQQTIYEEEVGKKIETVRIKALRAYELGLDMATRLAWQSTRVQRLEASRDRMAATIEASAR